MQPISLSDYRSSSRIWRYWDRWLYRWSHQWLLWRSTCTCHSCSSRTCTTCRTYSSWTIHRTRRRSCSRRTSWCLLWRRTVTSSWTRAPSGRRWSGWWWTCCIWWRTSYIWYIWRYSGRGSNWWNNRRGTRNKSERRRWRSPCWWRCWTHWRGL